MTGDGRRSMAVDVTGCLLLIDLKSDALHTVLAGNKVHNVRGTPGQSLRDI
jgi:hypothetical protein